MPYIDQETLSQILTPALAIQKDTIEAVKRSPLTTNEARYLVDAYYQAQESRVRMNNRVKGLDRAARKAKVDTPEPHAALDFFLTQFDVVEKSIKRILAIYADGHEMRWFFDQTVGVGPVLAAGFCAHIDPERAPTAGAVWRYAGLDPTQVWKKGEPRPWNASLKVISWKLGDCFVKISNKEGAFYGHIYKERKEYEIARNERGENKEAARRELQTKKYKNKAIRAIYESGKLPPGHIDSRARRYAVKLFLSHFLQRWREQLGLEVVDPWPIAHAGHAHIIAPPQISPEDL